MDDTVIEQSVGSYSIGWTPPKNEKLIEPVQSPSSVPLSGGSGPGIW